MKINDFFLSLERYYTIIYYNLKTGLMNLIEKWKYKESEMATEENKPDYLVQTATDTYNSHIEYMKKQMEFETAQAMISANYNHVYNTSSHTHGPIMSMPNYTPSTTYTSPYSPYSNIVFTDTPVDTTGLYNRLFSLIKDLDSLLKTDYLNCMETQIVLLGFRDAIMQNQKDRLEKKLLK